MRAVRFANGRSIAWALLVASALIAPRVGGADQGVRDASSPTTAAVAATAPAGGNIVTGTVMSGEPDGRPVRRALVSLKGAGGGTRAAVTDDSGRFTIAGLPAASYIVTVTKSGWVTTLYGARTPWRAPGVAVAVADGRPVEPLAIRMVPGGVIAGRILDPHGNPLVNVEPRLLELRSVAGHLELKDPTRQDRQVFTNDRGEFRFFGLPPGRYLIQAAVTAASNSVVWGLSGPVTTAGPTVSSTASAIRSTAQQRFVPTFYPDSLDPAGASPIVLGPGEQRTDIDVVIRAERTSSISGFVQNVDGTPGLGTRVWAEGRAGDIKAPLDWVRRAFAMTDARGAFTLPQIAPGMYVLSADASSGTAIVSGTSAVPQDLYAQAEVTVSGEDVSGVTLALRRGQTIAGHVTYDTLGARPDRPIVVRLVNWGDDPDATTTSLAGVLRPDDKGAFSFPGLKPGRYALAVAVAPGTSSRWMFRAATADGANILTDGLRIAADHDVANLTISLTDRASELTGHLLDRLGRAAPEYYVFAFPVDRASWHRHTPMLRPPTRPGTDGTYRIAPLPAGEYYLVALTGFEDADYLDPAFLEQLLPGALRVTLGDGEQKVQDIALR